MMKEEEGKRPTEHELFSWDEEEEEKKKDEGVVSNARPPRAAESGSDQSRNEKVGLRKPRSRKNKNIALKGTRKL